jgi:hypothetical protein
LLALRGACLGFRRGCLDDFGLGLDRCSGRDCRGFSGGGQFAGSAFATAAGAAATFLSSSPPPTTKLIKRPSRRPAANTPPTRAFIHHGLGADTASPPTSSSNADDGIGTMGAEARRGCWTGAIGARFGIVPARLGLPGLAGSSMKASWVRSSGGVGLLSSFVILWGSSWTSGSSTSTTFISSVGGPAGGPHSWCVLGAGRERGL